MYNVHSSFVYSNLYILSCVCNFILISSCCNVMDFGLMWIPVTVFLVIAKWDIGYLWVYVEMCRLHVKEWTFQTFRWNNQTDTWMRRAFQEPPTTKFSSELALCTMSQILMLFCLLLPRTSQQSNRHKHIFQIVPMKELIIVNLKKIHCMCVLYLSCIYMYKI